MNFMNRGERKYLTDDERKAFFLQSSIAHPETFLFCWLLLETGCRISEALHVTKRQADFEAGYVYFETLKRRRRGIYRAVPIPREMADLRRAMMAAEGQCSGNDRAGNDRAGNDRAGNDRDRRLWTWCRMTAYRHVVAVMVAAGISGPQASPKGLRHGFAVAALEAGVPINLVQRWLGHAHLTTTTIYADLAGKEERRFANRLWFRPESQPESQFQPQSPPPPQRAVRHEERIGRYEGRIGMWVSAGSFSGPTGDEAGAGAPNLGAAPAARAKAALKG